MPLRLRTGFCGSVERLQRVEIVASHKGWTVTTGTGDLLIDSMAVSGLNCWPAQVGWSARKSVVGMARGRRGEARVRGRKVMRSVEIIVC